jgi:hypothetical protein
VVEGYPIDTLGAFEKCRSDWVGSNSQLNRLCGSNFMPPLPPAGTQENKEAKVAAITNF